jgi:hypothetical protein
VFKYFLVDETGDIQDPAGFVTAVPNWTNGIFVVERLDLQTDTQRWVVSADYFRSASCERRRAGTHSGGLGPLAVEAVPHRPLAKAPRPIALSPMVEEPSPRMTSIVVVEPAES